MRATFSFWVAAVAIALMLLMIVSWWLPEKSRRERVIETMDASNGTWDGWAQKAFGMADKDPFLTSYLDDLYRHEGGIVTNLTQLGTIARGYDEGLRRGGLSAADTVVPDWHDLDTVDNFIDRNRVPLRVVYPRLETTVDATRRAKIGNALDEAHREAATKRQAFEEYTHKNIEHTSDAQNVHDSSVNLILKNTFETMQRETPFPVHSEHRIRATIEKKYENEPEKKKRALYGLGIVTSPNQPLVSAINATQKEVLDTVWTRAARHPDHSELMQEAVLDALADMSTSDSDIVCINGRCSRLIESNVTLDEAVIPALTVEQIRNDIFTHSNNILQDTIAETRESSDERLAQVARSYDDPQLETDESAEKEFKGRVVQKIDNYMQSQYADKLSDRDFKAIAVQCHAAVTT